MIHKIWKQWDQFWFSPIPLLNLAWMRVLLLGTLSYLYIVRSLSLDFFSDKTWVSRADMLSLLPTSYQPQFSWYFFSDSLAPLFHTLLVVLLVLGCLGIGHRFLLFCAWILDMAFIQRNYAINFGADVIGSVFLLYLSMTPCFERLSLLNLFRQKKNGFNLLDYSKDIGGSFFYRIMQIQISIIYAYTGFEKLKGGSWWDGTALWSVLGNPQMTTFDFSWIRHFAPLIALVTVGTILFEIYWPFAMLTKKYRHLFLAAGVLFHLGIAVMMGLMPFSLVMLSTYFLFVDPDWLLNLTNRLQSLSKSVSN